MDVVKLRTLTKKSTLGFGQYDKSVNIEGLISLDPAYLIWIYFNSSKISFVDEILDELFIDIRVIKPGTDRDKSNFYKNNYLIKFKAANEKEDYFRLKAQTQRNYKTTRKERTLERTIMNAARSTFSINHNQKQRRNRMY